MKEGLMEEKYCIICYEPIGDSELVEIPTPNYEPDKLAHRDCFLTKLEELTSDATRGKMLRYILAYEKNNDIDYLRDKSKSGIVRLGCTNHWLAITEAKAFYQCWTTWHYL